MFYQPIITGHEPYDVGFLEIHEYAAHWHSELEILFCVKGLLCCESEGMSYTAAPGEFIYIGSLTEHSFFSSQDSEILLLEFGSMLLGEGYRQLAELRGVTVVRPDDYMARLFKRVARRCRDADLYGSDDPVGVWQIKGCLFSLAAELTELLPGCLSDAVKPGMRVFSYNNIQKAISYVGEHFAADITVADVARLTGYSESNFCMHFKKAMQMSFHRYLCEYRVGVACNMLHEKHTTVEYVSAAVGIPQPKTFCRIFKSVTGKTPTEYRDEL